MLFSNENIINNKLLAVLLLSASLLSCSATDDEEDNEEIVIAELTEINEQFSPKVLWDKRRIPLYEFPIKSSRVYSGFMANTSTTTTVDPSS